MWTTVPPPLPSLPASNLDVPPCSCDTGLWSFKAITMALKQALNSIYHFKSNPPQTLLNPHNPSPPALSSLPAHVPSGSSDYFPLVQGFLAAFGGVKQAAWVAKPVFFFLCVADSSGFCLRRVCRQSGDDSSGLCLSTVTRRSRQKQKCHL